jgi:hypothetical protein
MGQERGSRVIDHGTEIKMRGKITTRRASVRVAQPRIRRMIFSISE